MVSEKQLKVAAQEFIEVMELKTGTGKNKKLLVLTKEMRSTEFTKIIMEAIPFIEPTDIFTPQTMKVIEELSPKEEEEEVPEENDVEEEEMDEPTPQEMAEKLHKKNIEEKPIQVGETKKVKPTSTPSGIVMLSVKEIKTQSPFDSLFDIDLPVLEAVKNDMNKNGYDVAFPIILWGDIVIDGHTRFKAASELKMKEVATTQKDFANVQEALEYAIHNQRDRRNLSEAELLRCISIIDQPTSKEEVVKKAVAGKKGKSTPKSEPTHKTTAKKLGVGGNKVVDARTVLSDEKAKEAVESGKKTIREAAADVRKERNPSKPKHTPPKVEVNRVECVMKAVNFYAGEPTYNLQEITQKVIEDANDIYEEKGGLSSEKEMSKVVEIVFQVMVYLNLITKIDEETIRIE